MMTQSVSAKDSGLFVMSILMSLFFIWLASLFLFLGPDTFGRGMLYLASLILVLAAFVLLGTFRGLHGLAACILAIILAIYTFARANGTIAYPLLGWIIGIICLGAVPLMLYITWPWRDTKTQEPKEDNAQSHQDNPSL